MICFYLLRNQDMLSRLREELKNVFPTRAFRPSLAQLEALPYLVSQSIHAVNSADGIQSAVVNEGLRCAHGVSSRQPRIPEAEDLQYKQYTIPRGTPVMQSLYLLHTDPKIFPEPFKFRPERWVENPRLLRYQFAFSRGSMGCIGMKYGCRSDWL